MSGQLVRILVDGAAENDGAFDLLDLRLRAGVVGAPEQTQPWADELLTVVSGQVEASLDGVPHALGPGDHLAVPAGSSFGWRCGPGGSARVLLKSRPSGAVRLYRLLGTSLGRGGLDGPGGLDRGHDGPHSPTGGASRFGAAARGRQALPLAATRPTFRGGR